MGTIPGQRVQVSMGCCLVLPPSSLTPQGAQETKEQGGLGNYRKAVGKGGRGRTGAIVAEAQLRTDTGT